MTENMNWADRRQFGRRPLNADAIAELPGQVQIPCVIENLSEGGALLSFPTGVAPIDLFDLTVEDVPFKTRCEMRYQVGIRFGVRFQRIDHGEALIRHFFRSTVTPATTNILKRSGVDRAAQTSASRGVRQFREALLPLLTPEAPRATEATDTAASPRPTADLTSPAAVEYAGAEPTETARPNSRATQLSNRLARLITRR